MSRKIESQRFMLTPFGSVKRLRCVVDNGDRDRRAERSECAIGVLNQHL